MKKDDSILEIFQDPLLTIIALVLLSTVWIVIPRGIEIPTGDLTVARKNIKRLKQDVSSIMLEITMVKSEMSNLEKELKNFETQMKINHQEIPSGELILLLEKVQKRKIVLLQKKEEFQFYESRIPDLTAMAEESNYVEQIAEETRFVKSEYYQKKKTENQLERELWILNEESDLQRRKQEKRDRKKKKRREKELTTVEVLELETKKLRAELDEILKNVEGGGYEEYSYKKTAGKKQILFEAVEDRIVFIDDENKNYSRQEGTWSISDDKEHTAYKLVKKYFVQGESIAQIHSPTSDFQLEMNRHDPRKEYIVFFVRNDSFEAFRKARALVEDRFVVGWVPQEGPIYLVGGGGNSIPGR